MALLSPQADHRTAAIKHRIRRLDLSVSKKTTRDGDLISSLRSSDHPGDDLDSSTTSFEAKQTVQFYTEDQDEEERERPLIPHWKSEAWLEEATLEMLDFDVFPLGHLSKADMESINGLMAAWAKRGSLHAALSVEKLLKRIVDDMRAGNQIAHVTSRMYTYAIEGWARSGARGSAMRAQHIHDNMVKMHEETQDKLIAPTVLSYNTLLNAWGKSNETEAPERAELILQEMLDSYQAGKTHLKPDAVTFSTIIDTFAKSRLRDRVQRCEELFAMMKDLGIPCNSYSFSALQSSYVRSGSHHAPQKTRAVLDEMIKLFRNGDMLAKPNVLHYNAVLHAMSKQSSNNLADVAFELLTKMEMDVQQGGYDVSPDRLSYALTILVCARDRHKVHGARLAEKTLERMEARAFLEARQRAEVSSVAPPQVTLDIECFNVALTAISRTRENDSFERNRRIIGRMEKYAADGQEHLRPNTRSWNALLNALARSPKTSHSDFVSLPDALLDHIFSLYQSGTQTCKPNAFTFAAVLNFYQKSADGSAAERADKLVRQMEEWYETSVLDFAPDVYHYTILLNTWAKSNHTFATDRCLQILAHMVERDRSGYPSTRPNVRTYNAVLDCLCRYGQEERAEELLFHMLRLYQLGHEDTGPDTFSFNSIINGFCRSKKRGSGRHAEAILERFLEYKQEENPRVFLEAKPFLNIITYYGKSREMDAPYRAEYILNRMVALWKDGDSDLRLTATPFMLVIESYAFARHPDAGKNADRMLNVMRRLMQAEKASDLAITTDVMNSVLFAWSMCGDENAGYRAEVHLNEMETSDSTRPNSRSYELVLSAWSKSRAFDKASRALSVLRRMQSLAKDSSSGITVYERAFSLVMNACAYTSGCSDSEVQAFEVACGLFEEMVESNEFFPRSRTFGWFLQTCSRLQVPEGLRYPAIEKAFQLCCESGLVDDFVLSQFRVAANDDMFERMVRPHLLQRSQQKKAGSITTGDLPKPWHQKVMRR